MRRLLLLLLLLTPAIAAQARVSTDLDVAWISRVFETFEQTVRRRSSKKP